MVRFNDAKLQTFSQHTKQTPLKNPFLEKITLSTEPIRVIRSFFVLACICANKTKNTNKTKKQRTTIFGNRKEIVVSKLAMTHQLFKLFDFFDLFVIYI